MKTVYARMAAGAALCFTAGIAFAQTQLQLNQQAAGRLALQNRKMQTQLYALKSALGADQQKLLSGAQRAWLRYRTAEAALLASKASGGSMYPMLYAQAQEQITAQRLRQLKADAKLFRTEGDL